MEWVAVSTMGFLAATAMVIALGRGTTARWEAEDADRAGRGEAPATAQPGSSARIASTVSASAASLSGRYRSTRANRSATPPG